MIGCKPDYLWSTPTQRLFDNPAYPLKLAIDTITANNLLKFEHGLQCPRKTAGEYGIYSLGAAWNLE